MIARFWNKVALLAQSVRAENPHRVWLVDMRGLFASRGETAVFLRSIGLSVDLRLLTDYREFHKIKNANTAPRKVVCDITKMESEIYRIALNGLSTDFLCGCGLASRSAAGGGGAGSG
jgi:hypothetical protein